MAQSALVLRCICVPSASREDGEGGQVVSRLKIVNANAEDVGSYSCSGDNGLGPASGGILVSGKC